VFDKKHFVVGLISAAVIFCTLFYSGIYLVGDPLLRESFSFSVIAQYIAASYPLPYSRHAAFVGAEQSLEERLDPFTFRMGEREYDDMLEESSGKYGGIGVTVVARDTSIMVVNVREGGPAAVGGVKSGDFIVAVDGKKVPADNPSGSIDKIRGASGTTVALTLYRTAIADTFSVRLTRSNIRLEHLPYFGMTDDKLAYIRIADFEAGTSEDLVDAVDSLENLNPVGYVIDLLGNPGGYFDEAIDAADIFLKKGTLIVGTDSRSRWDSKKYYASSDPMTDKPIVILTDKGTASAAEIFTGALRGARRAVVVGDTTFGKGLVQTVYHLAQRDAIRLTTARYYFADGRYLNPHDSVLTFTGLAPDLVYVPKGELAFESAIDAGFLLYDFVEKNWELLKTFPDRFNLPDSVITAFALFAQSRGFAYRSKMSETISDAIRDHRLDGGSREVLAALEGLDKKSEKADDNAFDREKEFLKFQIRRVLIEKKSGSAQVYRDVIVPGRQDIRLAAEILHNPNRYESLMQAPSAGK
jgi:carboxyl-terminal processing protease